MRTLSWMILSSVMVATGGLLATACSDDTQPLPVEDDDDSGRGSSGNNTSSSGDNTSSSGDNTSSSGNNPSSSGSPSSSSGGSSGGGGTCTPQLRPTNPGPYCTFAFERDSGAGPSCEAGQTCCNGSQRSSGGFDPTTCIDGPATDCPAPSNPNFKAQAYECNQPTHCTEAGLGVCCIVPLSEGGSLDPNTQQCHRLQGEHGTRCKASCAENEKVGCQSDAQCATGQTCKPVRVGPNIDMGYCTP